MRVRDGETQITDGPFAETKEYLAGYFLIEADDLDAALDVGGQDPERARTARSRSGRSGDEPTAAAVGRRR